ncbi:esterase-like activity of phytase family protein [Amycolatopsis lurida]
MNRLQQTGVLAVTLALAVTVPAASAHGGEQRFQRVSTLPVYLNSSAAEHTAAEIAAATPDGRTVVYTDSPAERIGFAELDDHGLVPRGVLPMPGEPTSVDIRDGLALVAVNTSESFTAPSGVLQVVDLASRQVVATHELGGQPDSIDISPDGRYAAIAVENERDEDVNDGALPQPPAGFLAVVDLVGEPSEWPVRRTELTGLAAVAPEDPEPEYVSINSRNEVAVTLQENNHLVVADLAGGSVLRHFSAGVATVDGVDVVEDSRIEPRGSVTAPREPDSVGWLDDTTLATADEGDYQGGSRTWTAFDARSGQVVFSSGADLENLAINQGQYPEGRAENKGVEPEGLAVATYGEHRYAFVGLERANLVAVYNVDNPRKPKLVQGLPTGVGPEGLLPIPARDALVVSAEEDSAEDNVRSSLSRYQLTSEPLADALQRNEGAPSITSRGIGFGALSGLSADGRHLAAVTDDAYTPSRILTVDVDRAPATVIREKTVTKDGQPVSYDLEGIAAVKGGYWLAVEGDGKEKRNLLVRTDDRGRVQEEVPYPVANATSNGFEGVAVVGEHVWVAVQRGWKDNLPGQTTLARYTPSTGAWAFAAYPLDPAPAGGWVGLSELTAPGDGSLLVLERDNRRGEQAQVKRVYKVDTTNLVPVPAGAEKPLVAKQPYRDLLPALRAGGGVVADKPEGLAVFRGELFAAVDNDGLDDAPGESVLLRLGR